MEKLWIRASLRVEPPLMLSVVGTHEYHSISWSSPTGVEVIASIDLDEEEFERVGSDLKAEQVQWVFGPAERIVLQLEFEEFGEEGIASLRPAEGEGDGTFARNGVRYRQNEELGGRIAEEVYAAARTVLDLLRIDLGQYWLPGILLQDDPQDSLNALGVEWRAGPDEEWARLFVAPWTSRGELVFGGEGDYLQPEDWIGLEEAIRSRSGATASARLVSGARAAFQDGLADLAVVKLNSAVELAVQGFLVTKLEHVIPEKSLQGLLRQAHGRLLDDWIKPWLRSDGREPQPQVLEAAKKLQHLRADAGHPIRDEGLAKLTAQDFQQLVVRASEFIAVLSGSPSLRFPTRRHGFGAVGKASKDT